jgi:hypothetical protein
VDTKPYHIDEKEGLPSTQRILIKTLEKEIKEKNTSISEDQVLSSNTDIDLQYPQSEKR